MLCCFLLGHTLRLLPTLSQEGPKQGQELYHILSACVAVIAHLVLSILALMPVWKLKWLEKSPGISEQKQAHVHREACNLGHGAHFPVEIVSRALAS